MFRLATLSLAVLVLSAPIAHAGGGARRSSQGIEITHTRTLLGEEERTSVPVGSGGEAPSVIVSRHSGQMFFASGRAAENLAPVFARRAPAIDPERAKPEHVTAPPVETRLVSVKHDDGTIKGALGELIPGSGIWITARHVVQGASAASLREALRSTGRESSDYLPMQFRDSAGQLDVVVFVPKDRKLDFFDLDAPSVNCASCRPDPIYKLKSLPQFRRAIEANAKFYSRQLGKRGDDVVTQESRGTLSAMNDRSFYLSESADNKTTRLSSGSLVQVSPADRDDYGVGGVTECVIAPSVQNGVAVPGGARVTPMRRLLDAEGRPTTIELLASEPPRSRGLTSDCIPVDDGRGGGGAYVDEKP